MDEPIENIGIFCNKECLEKAGLLKTYLKVPLEKFIGKYIKVGFPITDERSEFMWVMVKEITKEDNLRGLLSNDPMIVDYVKCDDLIEVSLDEVKLVQSPGSDKFLSEKDLL